MPTHVPEIAIPEIKKKEYYCTLDKYFSYNVSYMHLLSNNLPGAKFVIFPGFDCCRSVIERIRSFITKKYFMINDNCYVTR